MKKSTRYLTVGIALAALVSVFNYRDVARAQATQADAGTNV